MPNGGRQIDPTKYEARGRSLYREDGTKQQVYLHTVVERLLPTPVVNDMGEGKTVEAWDSWTERMQTEHSNGNGHGRSLSIEARRTLPTPAARDAKGPGSVREGGPTLPMAVEQLFPTPRSTSRRTSPRAMGEGSRSGPSLEQAAELSQGIEPRETSLADAPPSWRLLPTPSAADGERGPDYARENRAGSGGDDLVTLLARLNSGRTRKRSNPTSE